MNQDHEQNDLDELRKLIEVNVRLLATAQENLDKINRILSKKTSVPTDEPNPPQNGQD